MGGSGLAVTLRNMKSQFRRMIGYTTFRKGSDTSKKKQILTTSDGHATPFLQDWGFISVPPEGGEGVILYPEGNISGIMVKADCPTFRPSDQFAAGDVGLFNKEGVIIKLSGKSVTITGTDNINFGDSSLESLVVASALDAIKGHTHPVLGSLASISTDPAMIQLSTKTTKKVKAE